MIDSIKTSSYLENLFGEFKSGVNCSVKEMQVYAWFLISSSECNFLQKVILRICVVTLSFLSLSRPQLVFVLEDLMNTYWGDVSYNTSYLFISCLFFWLYEEEHRYIHFDHRNNWMNHRIPNDLRLRRIMSFKWKKNKLQQSEKLKAEKDECMWLQELNFKIRNIAIVDDDDKFTVG